MRRLLTLIACTAVASATLSGPAQAVADRDCSDFATQQQAQQFFIQQGGPRSDPHGLDRDGDGRACDSLPSGGGGGGGGTAPAKGRVVVVRVVDGDTVRVKFLPSGRRAVVQLIGVRAPAARCQARASTRTLRGMLRRGATVQLVGDPKQGLTRSGRLVRYVMKGSRDASRVQLLNGRANLNGAGKDFSRRSNYTAAQTWAKTHRRGIWSGRCR